MAILEMPETRAGIHIATTVLHKVATTVLHKLCGARLFYVKITLVLCVWLALFTRFGLRVCLILCLRLCPCPCLSACVRAFVS